MNPTTIDVRRIKEGQPTTAEMEVELVRDDTGLELVIRSEWRKRKETWGKVDTYSLVEFGCEIGRAFTLAKNDSPDVYNCLLANPQDSLCTCIGFEKGGYCKHLDALAYLLGTGELDNDKKPSGTVPDGEIPF